MLSDFNVSIRERRKAKFNFKIFMGGGDIN